MLSLLIARLLRAVAGIADRVRSKALSIWLKMCFPGLSIGPRVYIGAGTRMRVLDGATLTIGDRTYIEPRCLLVSEGTLMIGSDCFLGSGSAIVAVGTIEIGANALIAPSVSIRDHNHRFDSRALPYRLQGLNAAPVKIGSNVWLGTNVIVLEGVAIGNDAVVAAGAVVTKDVAGSSIVAGIPARMLKTLEH